mmetsp:Transcript_14334/g.22378  ORF Transcript_14334/g.22378 Transcript_14334/m.22378 type:complete len:235 (-) Transcript_14334:718-1422(-)
MECRPICIGLDTSTCFLSRFPSTTIFTSIFVGHNTISMLFTIDVFSIILLTSWPRMDTLPMLFTFGPIPIIGFTILPNVFTTTMVYTCCKFAFIPITTCKGSNARTMTLVIFPSTFILVNIIGPYLHTQTFLFPAFVKFTTIDTSIRPCEDTHLEGSVLKFPFKGCSVRIGLQSRSMALILTKHTIVHDTIRPRKDTASMDFVAFPLTDIFASIGIGLTAQSCAPSSFPFTIIG